MLIMEFAEFDRRPILVAFAGPNGAGKSTFFHLAASWPIGHPFKLRRRPLLPP